jgi:hypothetical protein
MLEILLEALGELLQLQTITLHTEDRIRLFGDKIGKNKFSRKDYLIHFKTISAPTASRDLKWAVDKGVLMKFGAQRLTEYQFS